MEVPGLGEVNDDNSGGELCSKPLPVAMFGGMPCRIVLEGYEEDDRQDEFHVAIANFLSGTPAVLREADEALFSYYKNFEDSWVADGNAPLKSPEEAWQHVQLGDEPVVSRREWGDRGIYISVSCGCDWEESHGLQIVFKNGLKVNKLGEYDGHLTNSDAYDDESLEDVIYHY
jgi:hypothetical protein